ncbi:MAG: DUF1345 domain-containing protein [Alphaproteobacteria bacterium]|nr:DUF1345 domain-containing protein [Alphaproteobacteria bacterium]
MSRARATGRSHILPWRYGLFLLLCLLAAPLLFVLPWHVAIMGGFDIGAAAFLLTMWTLLAHDTQAMRQHARENDANRTTMLAITSVVMLAILLAVAVELMQKVAPSGVSILLIVLTLMLAWVFSNSVYALHYAHLFYLDSPDETGRGGIKFPGTGTPNYWDFIYFAFTLGMTFQTSDVEITSSRMRRVATLHCLAAFVFNLGILAFTINVLGRGGGR